MKENLPVSLQKLIHKVEETFAEDPAMVELFINCFSNTLDTTVKKMEDGTTHVITGDIPAMWLRDSVAQVRPYLVAAAEDQEISDLLAGLSRRQFFFVNHDPYANAFNQEENGNSGNANMRSTLCAIPFSSHICSGKTPDVQTILMTIS